MKTLFLLNLLIMSAIACSDDNGSNGANVDPNDTSTGGDTETQVAFDYALPGTDSYPYGITGNAASGVFYVSAGNTAKIYTGTVGTAAAELSLWADFSDAQVTGGNALRLTSDGTTLVWAARSGVYVIDVATRAIVHSWPPASSSAPQSLTLSSDDTRAYLVDGFVNALYAMTLATGAVEALVLPSSPTNATPEELASGDTFPCIKTASQGFINASGVAATPDGKYAIVVHLVDKHLYRFELATRAIQRIDTGAYNQSGNGLTIADGHLYETLSDESRVVDYELSADYLTATFVRKLGTADELATPNESVRLGDVLLVANTQQLITTPTGGTGGLGGGDGGPTDCSLASGSPGGGMTLPPEATTACEGLASNAPCSFAFGETTVSGTCLQGDAALQCTPGFGGGAATFTSPTTVTQIPLQ